MLDFGIFVPHSPGLLPGFADSEISKFEKTIRALLTLAFALKENPPETLVVISPHADAELDRFLVRIPQAGDFIADFSEFKISQPPKTYPRDRILTAQIVESLNAAGLAHAPLAEARLDFATAIALYFLASALPEVAVVNIASSLAGLPEHQKFGEALGEVCAQSPKKIALIATGELSHKIARTSPLGFAPTAAAWEKKLLAAVAAQDYAQVFHADPFELDEVAECGVRPLVALLAAWQKISHTTQVLAHEAPAGIGLATILCAKKF